MDCMRAWASSSANLGTDGPGPYRHNIRDTILSLKVLPSYSGSNSHSDPSLPRSTSPIAMLTHATYWGHTLKMIWNAPDPGDRRSKSIFMQLRGGPLRPQNHRGEYIIIYGKTAKLSTSLFELSVISVPIHLNLFSFWTVPARHCVKFSTVS